MASNEEDRMLIAEAVRMVPKLARENQILREKNARYERRERLEKIAQALVDKKQIADHERGIKLAELGKLADADLARIEAGLSVISSSGSLSLGQIEQSGEKTASDGSGLARLLMAGDPENY